MEKKVIAILGSYNETQVMVRVGWYLRRTTYLGNRRPGETALTLTSCVALGFWHSFYHSLSNYLLSVYYVLDIMPI